MTEIRHLTWYIFLIVVFCLIPDKLRAQNGQYPVQNFSPTDYKAGIQNIDFAQNRDMTLFVANNLGVLSFNGSEWGTHSFKTGKKKRSLAFDAETDRLYVGSQGDFGYFTKNWHFNTLIDSLSEQDKDFDEVWDVFLIGESVFFCTFQAIYVYDGETVKTIRTQEGFDRSFQADGKLFTQTKDGTLLIWDGQRLQEAFPERQSKGTIAGIIAQNQGYLIIYNSGEIEWTNNFQVEKEYKALENVLRGTYVNQVMELSDTRLVVSTQTIGIVLYDRENDVVEIINKNDGLASNACLRTYQDYAGNLWVGMQNGIALVHINSPMRLLSRKMSIQGSGYAAHETPDGTYYTTSNGIYFSSTNQQESQFISGTEGPAYSMQEIAGKLYAGHHRGLFILENGTARQLAKTEGLWGIRQLRSRPNYAIGGTYEGLYLFQLNQEQQLIGVGNIQGFNASTRFFEEDEEGNIWVGQYYTGLYRLRLSNNFDIAETTQITTLKSGLEIEQIILSKIGEQLYLATKNGIFSLDTKSGILHKDNILYQEFGDQPIYLLAQDKKNNIHVIAEDKAGFFRQISAGNYAFVPSSLYQMRYHLNNDLLNVSTHTNRGVLFSGNEGFIQYSPELEDPLNIKQPLVISKVFSVNENKTLYNRLPFAQLLTSIPPIAVSPRAKVLKIEVESFQFNDMNNQQFRFFLEGFDDNYSTWSNTHKKEYTNLEQGKYEFHAQTRNYLGEVTSTPSVSLVVSPPFYLSPWAKIVYILTFGCIVLAASAFQRKRYKQKAQRIEQARQLELANKQKKLIEIRQLKEKELLDLKEEKMKSELQHVNKLLAASTMNLVVKNEFIESIREEIKDAKQKGVRPETKQVLDKIVKEINVTLRVQQDWEQFEYHFEKVHGDFLSRIRTIFPDLSPNEQKLCAFLRLNLNTKEIANLLSISTRGVEVARYRLRKKLQLETGQNLSKFILEY